MKIYLLLGGYHLFFILLLFYLNVFNRMHIEIILYISKHKTISLFFCFMSSLPAHLLVLYCECIQFQFNIDKGIMSFKELLLILWIFKRHVPDVNIRAMLFILNGTWISIKTEIAPVVSSIFCHSSLS